MIMEPNTISQFQGVFFQAVVCPVLEIVFVYFKIHSSNKNLLTKQSCILSCECKKKIFFFEIIVNDGKAPAGFFKRLSKKSLTAASRRNSEMPNQHFVIGIRKLHPLCNNMFLFGELPSGLLPIQTWQTDQIILYKNIRPRKTIIICLRPRSGHCKAHKYKWDVTYRTNFIMVTPLKKSFWWISLNYSYLPIFIHTSIPSSLFDKEIMACIKSWNKYIMGVILCNFKWLITHFCHSKAVWYCTTVSTPTVVFWK